MGPRRLSCSCTLRADVGWGIPTTGRLCVLATKQLRHVVGLVQTQLAARPPETHDVTGVIYQGPVLEVRSMWRGGGGRQAGEGADTAPPTADDPPLERELR